MRDNRPPKRFKDARSSGRFNKREAVFSKYGGNDRRSSDRDSGNRGFRSDRPRLEMFDVVCASCGKDTQVPFKPTTSKPVYCRDCFQKDGDSPRRDAPRREFRPRESGDPDQLALINRKLDKIMKALEIE